MNKIKSITLAIIFIILGVIIDNVIKHFLNQNAFNLIDTIECFVMTINLVFIIIVYYSDKHQKLIDEKSNYKMYWYKTFILDDNIKFIREFFDMQNSQIDKLINDKLNKRYSDLTELREVHFSDWTTLHNEYKMKICEIIEITEPEKSKKIRNIFIKLQDQYSNDMNSIILSTDDHNAKIIVDKIKDYSLKYKKEMLEILYDYKWNS